MSDNDDEWNGFSDDNGEDDGPPEPGRPSQIDGQPWDVPDSALLQGDVIPNPKDSDFATDFAKIEELQGAINAWARSRGFAVVRRHGRNKQDGLYTRFDILCDRFGSPRAPRGAGVRETATRKCDCKWKAAASRTKDGWRFHSHPDPQHSVHNHGPSLHPSAHTQHRMSNSESLDTIAELSNHASIRAREIRSVVNQEHDTIYTRKDIYNVRAKMRKVNLDGYTAAGALIKALDNVDGDTANHYEVEWADAAETIFCSLVWGFESCLEATSIYHDCMLIDLTYNTNYMGMPLYQVNCLTSVGKTLSTMFGLVSDETTQTFRWLMKATKKLRDKFNIPEPAVIVTDHCKELKQAISEVFPDSQQQTCIFHVIKNVMLNTKRKFKYPGRDEVDSEDEEYRADFEDYDGVSPRERAAMEKDHAERLLSRNTSTSKVTKPISHDPRGVEEMFKAMVYADDEPAFQSA